MSAPTSPLPEGARLIHIGPHKTGSTAVQVAMQEARDELARHGVHYATGRHHRPDKAGWAMGIRGRPAGSEPPPRHHWDNLVKDVAAAGELRVCISNEDFGRATSEQIEQLVEGLGGEAAHIVAVARRLDRYLPSQWQERVKAGDRKSYEEWLRIVLDRDSDEWEWDRKNVWFSHDTDQLVRRWTSVVGEGRFTLILSNEVDRELLPATFEGLLGLPAGTVKPNPSRSNRGLTWAETELVRAVNKVVAEQGWSRGQRRPFLKGGVLADMQSRDVPPGPKSPPLPEWAAETVRELSRQRAEQIGDLGVHVVGDPRWMLMPDDVSVAPSPLPPPELDIDVAAAAVAAVIGVGLRVQASAEDDDAGAS